MSARVIDIIFERGGDRPAIRCTHESLTYDDLRARLGREVRRLADAGVEPGAVIALEVDAGPASVVRLLSGIAAGAIVVPIEARARRAERERLARTAEAEWWWCGGDGESDPAPTGRRSVHRHYQELRRRGASGLVLSTSGSSGESKSVVHDVGPLFAKLEARGKDLRTLLFFHLDHISGIDTLFYALANGSEIVLPAARSVDAVCRAVETERVEVLPTSPSFLSLLELSEATARFDLSSLVCITYGGEVMPERTLERVASRFPGVRLVQKYGSTELGTLPARPSSVGSLWLELGGASAVRIVDGVLQVRAPSAMLGYLDGAEPFTGDGWLDTRDLVDERDGAIRFRGRVSEMISVGGEKVHPADVERAILELDAISDVVVYGEPNAILGSVVCAHVVPTTPIASSELRRLVRRHCRAVLARHAVPVRVTTDVRPSLGRRFKRDRGGVHVD